MESDVLQGEQEYKPSDKYKKQRKNGKDGENKKKKPKKRKGYESSDSFEPEKKRIKMEPDSDIEFRKKKKGITNELILKQNDSHDSDVDVERNLHIRVKEEQAALVASDTLNTKKKKKKKKHTRDIDSTTENENVMDSSNNEIENYLDMRVKEEQLSLIEPERKAKKKNKHKHNGSDSLSAEELNKKEMECYLNMKVKQEEASLIGSEVRKLKKKKNYRSSISSDLGNPSKSEVPAQLNGCIENSIDFTEPSDIRCTVIEDKFSAEETVIEKPKKKKHQKNNIENPSMYEKRRLSLMSNQCEHNCNDISLQPIEFSCTNIASSTVMNISGKETIDDAQIDKLDSLTENVLKSNVEMSRATKISDTIRFEDDESSSQDLNLNKTSPKVKAFLNANPHLQIAPYTKVKLTISDNDIWLLRCPHEICFQKLKNTNLSFEGKCKIKIDGHTYDGVSNEGLNRITLLTYQHGQASLTNLAIQGCVNYRKRIPKAHIPEHINMINNQSNFIPLPDTKCRHPLFGANFKKAIKIPAIVTERLEAAKSRHNNALCQPMIKKKHKKKIKDIKMEEDCEPESEPRKKKRKQKHSQDDGVPKKTKHKKYNQDSAEVWESEKAIEENLFNF